MNTLYIATYNRYSEIFDTREEAQAFAAKMDDDKHPWKTTIREIDFEKAYELCGKGRVSYFGEKWDGNNPNPENE